VTDPHHRDELSLGEVMLGSFIDDAHRLHPDDLPAFVRRKGALADLQEATVYVADKEQRELRELGGDTVHTVDGSLAGRAYQRSDVIVSDHDDGNGRVVWAPVLDGTARMGVLCVRVAEVDGISLGRTRQLAGAAASLLVSKSSYGDGLVRASYTRMPTLAASMRMSTLPPLAFDVGPIELGAVLEPAYEIAGDTFDYAIDADVLHLAIFDAMGHGLRSSQLATLAVNAYRWARRDRLALPEIYRAVDEVVAMEFGPDSFVTAQLATIELATGAIECVNAGHPQPLLLRDSKVSELAFNTCLPIGLGSGDGELSAATLQPGDMVVFMSDGTIEARSASGEQFGIERLGEHLLRAAAAGLTPSETMRRAAHLLLEHHGSHLDDDATLVSLTWKGAPRV
jgi:serine phosphatase RsbU (regulator of sigma subunit)